jgi:glycosyltransferase involved in cell wall biosynthesis
MTESKSALRYIIITSDEPWSDIWHTQLHYAHQLASRFNVIFVGPPQPWRFPSLWRFSMKRRQVEKNLSVIRYVNPLPAFFGRFSLFMNDQLNEFLITRNFFSGSQPERLLVWHFDRYRSIGIFTGNRRNLHIYHVIDPCANLNGDVRLARQANLVVVTSPKFISHYRELNEQVVRIGQGIDPEPYKKNLNPEQAASLESHDSVMLLGTITDSIDFSLLFDLASGIPNRLCLIGPDQISDPRARQAFEKLLALPNVKWLGAMPPDRFRPHLQACRVGIIAYNLEGINNNTLRSPLKVISYLAAGKCVISNIDCEIPSLSGKGIHLANNKQEFIRKVGEALRGSLLFDHAAVGSFLESISYDALLGVIFGKLGETLPFKSMADPH